MNYEIIAKEEFDYVLQQSPDFYRKLELYATMCRFNTFTAIKKAGSGHLGSSFSAMDVIVYLYLKELNTLKEGFDSPGRDIYFSSKGHDVPGLYSLFHSLGVISLDDLMKLRRLGGLDGHPDVRIKGIEANTGSLGMGISKAKGMAWAKRYKGAEGRVFVMTGDGEFQEGQIYESLQSVASQKLSNITVIVDRNKFQTDMLVDEVNSIENLEKKVRQFGWFVTKCNGHNFRDLESTFDFIKSVDNMPKLIIANTIKGKGLSFLEQPYMNHGGRLMYKWHSGAPDDEYFEAGISELKEKINRLTKELNLRNIDFFHYQSEARPQSNVSKEYVTAAYSETLGELAHERNDIVVLDGDLAADCKLRMFEYKYPDRFIENGIAEQDMVSMAGGLARMGLLPVVNTFASFLSSRANEQIYNNACENTKIIYTCHFAGLIPAGPGKSHQSVRDISLFGALPNCVIVQPCNAAETRLLTRWCINEAKENCAIRLVIGPSPTEILLPDNYILKQGCGATLANGSDAVMFAYGPVMLHEALLSHRMLAEKGFSLKVVNMPWLNRIDYEWLAETIAGIPNIFVLEDHSVTGGLGDYLLNGLVNHIDMNGRSFRKFGLSEYPECGTPPEVLSYHGLDAESLAESILGSELAGIVVEKRFTEEAPQ